MPVSAETREVETEIDQAIRDLPLWRTRRENLLRLLLNYYRDAIEVLFCHAAWGQLFGKPRAMEVSFAIERDLHAGMLQALKWAMEFSDSNGEENAIEPETLHEITTLGARYESLVDALKMASHGRAHISLDKSTRTIRVFEGGNRTGADSQLVSFQHRTLPIRHQLPFVRDDDQLTARWSAGDFRKAAEALATSAAQIETETIMSKMPGETEPVPLFRRPVVFDLPKEIFDEHKHVFEDIVLDPAKVAGDKKWKLTAWLDIPLTLIEPSLFVVSSVVRALSSNAGDDYMLRVAARVDPVQYSTVSELRHKRMIEACKQMLQDWNPKGPLILTDPEMELDVFGSRQGGRIVLEIKSTLRPETPWEVLKRNEEIISGINHTARAIERLGPSTNGFLITDGYRGDYQTWEAADAMKIPIGTVEDIPDIAADPDSAIALLKARAGFNPAQPGGPVPDRQFKLLDWTIELIDAPFPK